MFKNVASQKVTLLAIDTATNLPKPADAANITAYVSKDDGAVTVLADTSATEKEATNALGLYDFDLAQAETNADKLVFSGKSSTSGIRIVPMTIYTRPPNFSLLSVDSNGRLDMIKMAGTTLTGRDIGTSVLLSAGTGTGQLDFTSGVLKTNMVQLLGTAVPTPAGNQVGYIPCNVYYGAGVLVEDPGDPPDWYTEPDNTGIGTLLTRLSSARAGYLDNLNVGGAVASQADVTSINQSASRRVILTTVGQYERPETGTVTYTIEATTYSRDGVLMDATGDPTLTAVGPITGSLAANLSAVDNPQTGYYRWTYTVAAAATKEEIRFGFSAVVDGDTITLPVYSQVVDLVSATWNTSDRTLLTNISNKLPSKAYLTGTANSDGDPEASDFTGNFPGSVASVNGNITGNLSGTVGSVTGAVGSIATGGITTASFATGAINAAAIATDAIGADEVAAGAVTKIQAGLVKVGTSFLYTNDNSLVNEEVTITANP